MSKLFRPVAYVITLCLGLSLVAEDAQASRTHQKQLLELQKQFQQELLQIHQNQMKIQRLQLRLLTLQMKVQKLVMAQQERNMRLRRIQLKQLKIRSAMLQTRLTRQSKKRAKKKGTKRTPKRPALRKSKSKAQRIKTKRNPKMASYQGYFVVPGAPRGHQMAMQHPRFVGPTLRGRPPFRQMYFNIVNQGRMVNQIVLLVPSKMKLPKNPKKQVVIRGTVRKVSLGGRRGTKRSYKNVVMTLFTWNYAK